MERMKKLETNDDENLLKRRAWYECYGKISGVFVVRSTVEEEATYCNDSFLLGRSEDAHSGGPSP
jgi:hypothetical protein